MSQQHDAGAPDEPASGPHEGASGASAQTPPPPPRDERPRPQYGEYAPEGWTWQPPADQQTSDPAPQMVAPPAAASVDRPDRTADRVVTIVLLVIGIFGVWTAIGTLQALPEQLPQAIRQASEILGGGATTVDYTPGPQVPGILLGGSIGQVVLWLLTAWWAVSRLRARRIAFWVPLVGGVVSLVLLYGTMFIVIATDPDLVASLSGT